MTVSQTHIRALLNKLEQFPELEAENRKMKEEISNLRSGKELRACKKEITRLRSNLNYYKKKYKQSPRNNFKERKE